MSAFQNTMSAPPGGEWFWEDKETFIHSPSYSDVIDAIRRRFREKGVSRDPAEALAEYMCPRMPRGFCRGAFARMKSEPKVSDYVNATIRKCLGRDVEDVATIQRRLEVCDTCPKCRRPTCVTCRGIDKAIYKVFEGRRAVLALDPRSGVCSCDGTFTMGVASVRQDGSALEGAPDTCWRNKK